jgi:HEAT repeat protein
MNLSETNAPIAQEWARLRAFRKAGDAPSLLLELTNPQTRYDEVWGRSVCQTVRGRAIQELEKLGRVDSVQPIAKLLTDPEPTVRADAAIALGRLGDSRIGESLVASLSDSDDSARQCVVRSLGQLKFRPAVKPLTELLADENVWIQMAAAKALARIGDKSAARPLKMALKKQSWRHPLMRSRLQWALLTLRSKS